MPWGLVLHLQQMLHPLEHSLGNYKGVLFGIALKNASILKSRGKIITPLFLLPCRPCAEYDWGLSPWPMLLKASGNSIHEVTIKLCHYIVDKRCSTFQAF